MAAQSPVGVLIPTTTSPEELVPTAKFVEEQGFAQVWVAEDYFFLGGVASAAMVLEATSEIAVGIGVLSAVVRHPAVTAMELATLARAHPGRLLPGIGHGVPAWTQQMGLYPPSPLRTFREVLTSLRRLLDGETLTEDTGTFTYNGVTLTHPAPGLPLYGGVVGPKSLELSGEVADGTVLSVLAGPKYVELAAECAARGMAKAGRTGAHQLPTFTIFAVDDDGEAAKAAVKDTVAFYLAAVGPTALSGAYGANEALAEMLTRGGPDLVAKEMPADWLEAFAVAGTPAECTAKIEALLEAGAASVVLVPTPADRGRPLLEQAAKQILPQIGRA